MIKTEARRSVVENLNIKVPEDVQKALDAYNARSAFNLELHFDDFENAWQFYNNKHTDVVCWQMSLPTKGTTITPGALDWLRQYDTSNGGMLDQDELRSNWLKQWKRSRELEQKREDKQQAELHYVRQDFIRELSVERTLVCVPVTVGITPDGKKIVAQPKGTKKRMDKQRELIKHG